MTLEIQVMGWGRQKNVAVLSRVMGSQTSHLDNWIFNGNTYINKRLKNLNIFSSTQTRSHTTRTMNDDINMDIIIAGLNITPGHIKDRHISFIYIWSDVITFCRFVPQSYHILQGDKQKSYIKEGPTLQWQKEKDYRSNNDLQSTSQKTKHLATQTLL
jgi:hypothetical protein